MRVAGSIAMQSYGLDPRSALHRVFVASTYCRTALIDEKPVAMWGVAGHILSETAFVWLVLAEETARMPHAIVREARAELQRVMDNYSRVMMTVLPDDAPSVRFALHLGFRPMDGDFMGGEQDALSNPRFRLPVGDSYVVQMGYAPSMVN